MAVVPSTAQGRVVDQIALQAAVRLLLASVDDPTREGLIDTPRRVVKALAEMTSGNSQDPDSILSTTFTDEHDEMIVVTGIEFTSLCEHHLLPFSGIAHVGYLPGKIVSLSKIPRLVDCYARRLQLQERLTRQIAETMEKCLNARGVGVIIEAHHSCMGCRGVRKPSAKMVTSCMLKFFRDDDKARAEFLSLCRRPA